MTDTYQKCRADSEIADRAIATARNAASKGEMYDLTPLTEMVGDLCERAKSLAADTGKPQREDIANDLQLIVESMNKLEDRLEKLVAGDGLKTTGGG